MRERFFSAGEAADILGIPHHNLIDPAQCLPQRFRVDSREVRSGDAFVAVRGARTDGHLFIEDAVSRGARAVLLEEEYGRKNADRLRALGVDLFPVADPERSLAALARAWLDETSARVVGITGSVGKTTTREILHAILARHCRTHAAERSHNTRIGCAMTVLSMPPDCETLILELGTNRPGEIRELVTYFPVTHALITEVSPAHLEGLHTLEGVLAAKMEILESEHLQFLSYNFDNDSLRSALKSFSESGRKTLRVARVGAGGDLSVGDAVQTIDAAGIPRLRFLLHWGEETLEAEAPIFGRQHAKNAALACATAHALGLPKAVCAAGIADLRPPSGRGGILRAVDGCIVVDETYNANPASVSQALKNVLELELPDGYERVAILGGMRELGDACDHWHEVVMSRASLFDAVYLVGEEWEGVRTQQGALRGRWGTTADFERDFDRDAHADAVFLLKGSRYYRMESLLPLLLKEGRR